MGSQHEVPLFENDKQAALNYAYREPEVKVNLKDKKLKTMLLSPAVVDLVKSATGASQGKRTLPM
ncbi:hypothetical protein [Citrobacter freundii]|uniref:hypothetical protein n=1 Tax=Citrobacter freundii TaxID=546 RepID=UPI0013D6509B|nr:hypothetical protein [Citrobacter freundii]EJD6091891.1 hypothetical protein [Citrobacter freundii]EKS9217469.1 hypothetical protein [Citrobacter freundii]MDU5549816.1 hypothetical protein [Citrobacter freundii]HAT7537106.1 hypothetical protein [Citrobacter freundii]HED1795076.1 hypothetical protein [Citrobacter freundii]